MCLCDLYIHLYSHGWYEFTALMRRVSRFCIVYRKLVSCISHCSLCCFSWDDNISLMGIKFCLPLIFFPILPLICVMIGQLLYLGDFQTCGEVTVLLFGETIKLIQEIPIQTFISFHSLCQVQPIIWAMLLENLSMKYQSSTWRFTRPIPSLWPLRSVNLCN